jgi:hypothetical protein
MQSALEGDKIKNRMAIQTNQERLSEMRSCIGQSKVMQGKYRAMIATTEDELGVAMAQIQGFRAKRIGSPRREMKTTTGPEVGLDRGKKVVAKRRPSMNEDLPITP